MDYLRVTTPLGPAPASLFTGGQPADLIALADLKLELNITATTDDAYLQKLITRASVAAAKFCNRVFVPTLWQDQIFPAAGPYPWQLPPTLSRLQLRQWPVLSAPSTAGITPPAAPVLSAVSNSQDPAAGTYFVRLSYVTATGETALGPEAQLACATGTLPQVAAPGPDPQALATGYNVYAATTSYAETVQNGSNVAVPIAVTAAYTLPNALFKGIPNPNYIDVVEGTPLNPRPLAEGVDFLVDYATGQIERLWAQNRQPRPWSLPATVIYQAGYSTIPDDLQEAVILLAKMRWFARSRDPMIRSQTVVGDYEGAYWLGTGLGGEGDLPIDVADKLERYRVRVVA